MSTIEKIEKHLNDIIKIYPNLMSKIQSIRLLINILEPEFPVLIEQTDYEDAKNNPPLCLNRQRDYYEWLKECQEYEKNVSSNK